MVTFQEIVDELVITEQVTASKWFGLPGMMANGYIFCALWRNGDLICKLRSKPHARAIALEGAALFDPGGDGHPMREWVQIPPQHSDQWKEFALDALEYIRDLPPKERKNKKRS